MGTFFFSIIDKKVKSTKSGERLGLISLFRKAGDFLPGIGTGYIMGTNETNGYSTFFP